MICPTTEEVKIKQNLTRVNYSPCYKEFIMAMQIDKGAIRSSIKMKEKRYAKKLHRRQKRREAKNIENENPKYNRYTDGWCM